MAVSNYKRYLLGCGIAIMVMTAFFLYKKFNPVEHNLFPQCPSKYLTGYDCPGCGSQRAVHSFLNGELSKAFRFNPLLFILLPYGIVVGVFEWIPALRGLPLRKLLINFYVIIVILSVIILFTIWRNL